MYVRRVVAVLLLVSANSNCPMMMKGFAGARLPSKVGFVGRTRNTVPMLHQMPMRGCQTHESKFERQRRNKLKMDYLRNRKSRLRDIAPEDAGRLLEFAQGLAAHQRGARTEQAIDCYNFARDLVNNKGHSPLGRRDYLPLDHIGSGIGGIGGGCALLAALYLFEGSGMHPGFNILAGAIGALSFTSGAGNLFVGFSGLRSTFAVTRLFREGKHPETLAMLEERATQVDDKVAETQPGESLSV